MAARLSSHVLTPDNWELIAHHFHVRRYQPRTQVTPFDSDAPELAFIVLDGVFRVYVPFEDGSELVKWLLIPGASGITPYRATELSILARLESVTAGELATADLRRLERAAESDETLRELIDRRRAEYEAAKERRIFDDRTLSARERYDIAREELGEWASRIPLYEIASYIGVTPVQLSRIRRHMSDLAS